MIAHTIKTNEYSGVTGRMTVALDKETGSVLLQQKILIKKTEEECEKECEKECCDVLRETDNYIFVKRLVHIHRNTFGEIIPMLSDLISRTDLPERFPENFINGLTD